MKAVSLQRLLGRLARRRPRAPVVSVVIPVYNAEAHLAECLDSVLRQGLAGIQVICVDDGSTDASPAILGSYQKADPRLIVIRSPSNRGAARARNLGLEAATGTFVQFTDADDLLPPRALSAMYHAAVTTGATVVRGQLQVMTGGRTTSWPAEGEYRVEAQWPRPERGLRAGALLDLPELWIPWFHVCFLVSRRLLDDEGIRYPALCQGEDPAFLGRVLAQAKHLCIVPQYSYIYRIWPHRPSPTVENVRDYIHHAEMVRDAFDVEFRQCWDAYKAFIFQDVEGLVAAAGLEEATGRRWLDRFGAL